MAILSRTTCLADSEVKAFVRAGRESFRRGVKKPTREVLPSPTGRPREALMRFAGRVWRGGHGWTPCPRD